MKKGKAVLAAGINLKVLTKVPTVIKSTLEKLKTDLTDLKDMLQDLKNNIEKLGHDAHECIKHNLQQPLPCYKKALGTITYT